MVNLREDTRESIAKLTLMDDIFMNKVFENDTERTALLLRIILNNDKIKVIKAVTQQKLKTCQDMTCSWTFWRRKKTADASM